jgi:hypothetical protein
MLNSNDILTVVELSDVRGAPKTRISLPAMLKKGDPIALKFTLERMNQGRQEVLEVNHRFRVDAVGLDAASNPRRQLLSVVSTTKAPTWRSVKKRPLRRPLGPAKHPRTSI